jgi:hypothetical protein
LRLQRPKNPEKTKGVRADPARGGRAAIPAFPAPPEYVGGVHEYLGQIANSEQCDCPTRVKAAVEVGTLYGLKLAGRMQRSLQVHLAFEDALERYARRFPPPEAPLDPKWEKSRSTTVTSRLQTNSTWRNSTALRLSSVLASMSFSETSKRFANTSNS